ncbi:MAG: NAD(P)-dependent oxidoreductase, partial [Streptosporangiaceae bacterium]
MSVPPVYPLGLDLTGRKVVVVGGGRVALRRTRALVEAGALVTVIAPRFETDFLKQKVAQVTGPAAGSEIMLVRREYRDGDLAGAWLVHAATDNPAVNAAVAAAADRDRVWCVRADDAAASAAWTPAVTRHGDVTVAVTAGGDPRRSQALRAAIATALAEG